ncbi:MAG: hypothetical protein ACLT3D_12225 [Lawsonibacter sp.]
MEERSRRPFGTMPDGTQVEEITLRRGPAAAHRRDPDLWGGGAHPHSARPERSGRGCGAGL